MTSPVREFALDIVWITGFAGGSMIRFAARER